jgi:sugar lactone lactonase YvrE
MNKDSKEEKEMKRTIEIKNLLAVWAAGLLCAAAMAPAALEAQSVAPSGIMSVPARNIGSQFNPNYFAVTNLAVSPTGNFYFAIPIPNEVVEVGPGGSQTLVYQDGNWGSGLGTAIAVDRSGNLYLADSASNGVLEIAASGTQTSLGSGWSQPTGIAVDSAGNIYVADNNGVSKMTAGGGSKTAIFNNGGRPYSVAVDPSGNLFVGLRSGSQVYEITTNGVGKWLGSGLSSSWGIAVDGDDNVFIADAIAFQVVELTASGYEFTVSGSQEYIQGVAVDQYGNLFIPDQNSQQIDEFQFNGIDLGSVNTCPTSQTTPAPCSQTISLPYVVEASGTLGTPKVVTQGASGVAFTLGSGSTCTSSVTEGSTCTVSVTFTPTHAGLRSGAVELTNASGSVVATTFIRGTGDGPQIAFTPAAQTSLGTGLARPIGVAVDGAGNAFVADSSNNRVVKVASGGVQTTLPLTGLNRPSGIALDGAGNLFIADLFNSRVVELTSGGTQVIVPASGLVEPTGVAVDGSGNLFISEGAKNAIVKLTPDGTQTTVPASGLSVPEDVAVDGFGDIFIADYGNDRVVEVSSSGAQTTVPASGLNGPFAVAVDAAGDVLIADGNNNRVVAVAPSGAQTTVASGVNGPEGVAVDGAGDLFVSSLLGNSAIEVSRSQAPALTFAPIPVNSDSAAQSVTIQNTGNAPLATSGLSVAANFAYVDGPGSPEDCTAATTLAAGASCNLSIGFEPSSVGTISGSVVLTDDALNASGATQTIELSGTSSIASQTISFTGLPAAAIFGAAGPYTLNATATSGLAVSYGVTGPAAIGGNTLTITGAGTLVVTASQAGNSDYSAAAAVSQTILVSPETPSIAWAAPTAITYGTALSGTQLNATSTVGGVFAYSPAAGTVLGAGSQTLSVTFTPTDTTDYASATSTVTLTVDQATPAITWAAPAAITYGTALNAAQLNATSTVAGTFAYSPAPGIVLGAGSQTLSVTFTPTDTTDYTTATSTVILTVNQATPSIAWAAPAAITFGTVLSAAQLNASSTVAGAFTYSPAAGTTLTAGSHSLSVTFTPTDTTDYATATSTVTLTVNQATPSIAWAAPAAITYGTALSAAQLNATSTVAGSFTYSPAAGTTLTVGQQQLSATFTPTDTADYTTATATMTLAVNQATPSISWAAPAAITYGTALTAAQLNAASTVAGAFTYSLAAGTILSAGQQQLSVTFTPTDTTDYTQATATVTMTVNQASQTIDFLPITGTLSVGGAITLSATASSNLPVRFVTTTPSVCTVSGTTASLIAGGSCDIEAQQWGNSNYATAAFAFQIFWVEHTPQTIDFPTIPFNQNAGTTIALSATASSGLPVTFASLTPATCTVSGDTASLNSYGDCTIQTSQGGNNVYGEAAHVDQTIFIHHLTQTIAFGAIPSQTVGSELTLSATSSSGLAVSLTSTTPSVCTVSGTTATLNATGTCAIEANQAGNGVYGVASAVAQSFEVVQ